MTAPIQEPNVYRHLSGQTWITNQLLRRPVPAASETLPFAFVTFSGEYGFAGHSYPDWDWALASIDSFATNDLDVFNATGSEVELLEGTYVANMKLTYQVNGQFLDLPPQAGTTRLHPGALATSATILLNDGGDIEQYFYTSEQDYDLSNTIGNLGEFTMSVAGILLAVADSQVFPLLSSGDALIGPNGTGSFPADPPPYSGSLALLRVGDIPDIIS